MRSNIISLRSNKVLDSKTLSLNGTVSEPFHVRMFQRSVFVAQSQSFASKVMVLDIDLQICLKGDV